jgi:hypothetical protein
MAQTIQQTPTATGPGASLLNIGSIGEVGSLDQSVHRTTSATGQYALSIGEVTSIGHLGNVQNLQVIADTQFFELKTEELRADPWLDPAAAEPLVESLLADRLLIVAGPLDDKAECARHLAYKLRERLVGRGAAEVLVREAWQDKDPQRIESALGAEAPTILLLIGISKSQVAGYDPARLREVLRNRQGYAIVTTDCSREQWDLDVQGDGARVWRELSWETYYGGAPALAHYLSHLIYNSELPVPDGMFEDGPDQASRLAGIPLVEIAGRLKSPGRLRYFAAWLLGGGDPKPVESISAKLNELAGDASAIGIWYQQFEPRDQLLVLGLALLDGLPDDLLFAGLELLVEDVWRSTDPLLAQFDYRDLSRFAAYFKETHIDGGRVRIESSSRAHRRQILRAAWQHQRRRLLATLPTLTEMIRLATARPGGPAGGGGRGKEPASGGPGDAREPSVERSAARALGRTGEGSLRLQEALADSLSLIGLLSIEVVEPYFLDLAADPSEDVQHLVAGALAAWREDGKDEELFALLRTWWAEACNVGDVQSRIARAARLEADPWAAVRAAVALTIAYAAPHDRADDLQPALVELLSALLLDQSPRVRSVVVRYTLPRTVVWHFRQLEPVLRRSALASPDLVSAVARGAAAACEERPEVCLPILESWRAVARGEPRAPAALPRAAMLATVARAYGFIRCDDGQARLSTPTILSKLRAILLEEGNPFVRRHAFLAVEEQTRRDFGLAAQLLPAVLARVTLDDRPSVVQLAVRTYLHQRRDQKGGDRTAMVDHASYSVWTSSARPLTGLEASLYSWILDDSRPVAQQLAVDIFAALSDTAVDREERALRAPRRPTAETPRRPPADPTAAPAPEMNGLWPLGHLAVLLATPRKPQIRKILKPLLAEAVVESRRRPPAANPKAGKAGHPQAPGAAQAPAGGEPRIAVGRERIEGLLSRWAGMRNAATDAIAAYLRRAYAWYRWRWALVLALLLLLGGSWYAGSHAWAAFTRYRAASRVEQESPVTTEPAMSTNGPMDPSVEETDFGTR